VSRWSGQTLGLDNNVPGQVVQASGDTKVQNLGRKALPPLSKMTDGMQTAVNTGSPRIQPQQWQWYRGTTCLQPNCLVVEELRSATLEGGNVVGPGPSTDVGHHKVGSAGPQSAGVQETSSFGP